jgi:hypothetical protein
VVATGPRAAAFDGEIEEHGAPRGELPVQADHSTQAWARLVPVQPCRLPQRGYPGMYSRLVTVGACGGRCDPGALLGKAPGSASSPSRRGGPAPRRVESQDRQPAAPGPTWAPGRSRARPGRPTSPRRTSRVHLRAQHLQHRRRGRAQGLPRHGTSRRYGGIHWQFGGTYARDVGKKLGEGAFSLAKKLWEGG